MIKTMLTHKAKNIKAKNIIAVTAVFFLTFPSSAMALCFRAEAVVNTDATPCLMTLLPSGQLGLGTQEPGTALHLTTPNNTALTIDSTSTSGVSAVRFGQNHGSGQRYPAIIGVKTTGATGDNNLHFVVASNISATPTAFDNNSRMVIMGSNGNVGIGTVAPASLLHVSSADDVASASSSEAMIRIANTSNADNRPTIRFQKADALSGNRYADIRLNNKGTLEFGAGTSSGTLEPVKLAMTATGDVGIGTSAPQSRLHVAGGGYTQTRAPYTGGISMNIDDYNTARASIVLDINAANGIGVGSDYMYIAQTAHIGSLHSAHNTPLSLGSNGDHVRIAANGRVGIGTAVSSGRLHINSDNNETKLIIQGYGPNLGYGAEFRPAIDGGGTWPAIFFNAAGSQIGGISASATNTTYNTTSDYRLKENITPVSAALERVSALKPSHYNFKNDPNHPMDGFIAHELQTIAPYAVSGDKDAIDAQGNPIYQQVDYGKITPLLAAAIQELAAEVEALRAEIQALKTAP